MRVRILAIGGRAPAWVEAGFEDYRRRLGRSLTLEVDVIRPPGRGGGERARQQEGEKLFAHAGADAYVVALDERGDTLTTKQFATRLDTWRQRHREVCICVGGADGLAPDLLRRADERISLSALTLPHALVRIVVAEQIYRALTLLAGHPYHRE